MTLFGLAYLFAFSSNALYGPFAPAALLAAGIGAGTIGHAGAVQSAARVLAQPLWGGLADRTKTGLRLSALSYALGALSFVWLAFSRSETGIVLGYFLFGVLGGAGTPLLDSTVIHTAHGDRARFARVRVMGTIGFGLTTVVVSGLREAKLMGDDPNVVFLGAAAFFSGSALMLLLAHPSRELSVADEARDVPNKTAFFLLAAIAMLQWASHGAYNVFIVPVGAALGMTPWSVGIAIFSGLCVEALTMHYAHRIHTSATKTLVLATLAASLRWLLYPFATNTIAFVGLSALHGVSFGLFFPTVVAEVARLAGPGGRHRAQSTVASLSFGLGSGLGTFIAGTAFEAYGPAACFWSMLPLSIGATALCLSRSFFEA